ncbi:hypothetical protein DdX_00654 [Ditylenchus destructor]|uniref:Uncharacterized protein n=1 Tax=Ditylenchus destructor TaxID=166010 RepID=A0AAD4NKY5_9BILA|nr:hypothetical protein DdX_00654 [Ditylenchus destructor]
MWPFRDYPIRRSAEPATGDASLRLSSNNDDIWRLLCHLRAKNPRRAANAVQGWHPTTEAGQPAEPHKGCIGWHKRMGMDGSTRDADHYWSALSQRGGRLLFCCGRGTHPIEEGREGTVHTARLVGALCGPSLCTTPTSICPVCMSRLEWPLGIIQSSILLRSLFLLYN